MSTEKKQTPEVPPTDEPHSKASLRQKAEKAVQEMLGESPEQIATLPPESLHELRVHQIELEMQNEELRGAEAELVAACAKYFDLYDMAPVGYCTISEKGMILEANLTAGMLLGVDRGALVKQPVTRFIVKEDQDVFFKHRQQLFKTGKPQQCELRLVKKDGPAFWAQLSAKAAKDEAGAPVCRVALNDISGRKQTEDVQSFLARTSSGTTKDPFFNELARYLARSLGTDFICIDRLEGEGLNARTLAVWCDGRFEDNVTYALKDTPCGDVVGKEVCCFPASVCQFFPRDQVLKDLRAESYIGVTLWSHDGRPIGLIAAIGRSPLTNRPQAEATLKLVAERASGELERLAAEEDLRELNRHLENEKALAEVLAIKAEAGARAKSEFFTVMSHELRTPLNAVLGFSELLSDTTLDDEQKSFVRTIASSGEHLLAVVDDVLDFSSVEKGVLEIKAERFATADLLESSVNGARKSAADKGLEFRCETAPGLPEKIFGDERRIRQILINFLANAIKFTDCGTVVLRVAPACDGGRAFLDFSIEDTGIGISSETLGRLFQPFVQADATMHRRFGGTGLGLAISKRIAEAMGGSVTGVSTPGKGSTFTFRLPLEISTPSSKPADSATCNQNSTLPTGTLVLVADDEKNSTVLAGKMLQSLGCRAEFAADGAEAVKAFVPGKFSAILMDMAMPVMDGLEATEKIREIEAAAGCHVPIIAFTANVMPGDRERCLAAGMDDFLTKPFKKTELADKLSLVVGWKPQNKTSVA